MTSNRDNPTHVEYYKTLADIIAIFWQIHKERIQMGNIDFAYMAVEGKFVPFDPNLRIDNEQTSEVKQYSTIEDFAGCVSQTLNASWQQFLEQIGQDHVDNFLNDNHIPFPEECKRLTGPYVKALIEKADRLGRDVSVFGDKEGYSINAMLGAGINVGSGVTTRLKATFGEEFKPAIALVISKIKLEHVQDAVNEIGYRKADQQPDYTLLDHSPYGLNRRRLTELGLGKTLGCPASMPIGKVTRTFLTNLGADPKKATMLDDFSTMLSLEYDLRVRDWYRELSDRRKELFIERETRDVLGGTVYHRYVMKES